ncbi:MAG: hypothetical protein A2782_00960 [Candidatus Blackburnbacteria bacterium RIFCSPHIGHO2_01_FULL_43_15b]|uniref:Uncharacterized protein n=1 Tax=Candidatus Blackburnbacteria bacterium RIFCSPHIGHO2_01_FULL_43_15b TaxID=1797513 RepID=A0A1G1V0Y2_9BACT|nr:MAG: hypothetical protein A2782_00960 [Candidatus Blackburnbacteria bacterium RIFCSPHIGHO2_01_FULL_43_15b]
MSKLFYDHLIILEEVEIELGKLELDRDEKRELEELIEETLHHRVLDRVLSELPRVHHEEFLQRFAETPHDPCLIGYLNKKIEQSVEEHIQDEVKKMKKEIMADIQAGAKEHKGQGKKKRARLLT